MVSVGGDFGCIFELQPLASVLAALVIGQSRSSEGVKSNNQPQDKPWFLGIHPRFFLASSVGSTGLAVASSVCC